MVPTSVNPATTCTAPRTTAPVIRRPTRAPDAASDRPGATSTTNLLGTGTNWTLPIRYISIAHALVILEAHYEGILVDSGARIVSVQDVLADVLAEVEIRHFVELMPGSPRPLAEDAVASAVEWIDLVYPAKVGPGSVRREVLPLALVSAA